MVGFMTARGPCQLKIGTYQEHWQQVNNKGTATSTETEPHAAIAADLPQSLRECRVESEAFCAPGNLVDRSLDRWMFLGTDFMISILAPPHI